MVVIMVVIVVVVGDGSKLKGWWWRRCTRRWHHLPQHSKRERDNENPRLFVSSSLVNLIVSACFFICLFLFVVICSSRDVH